MIQAIDKGARCAANRICGVGLIALERARAKALHATDPRSKRRMLGVADSYERLAERLEQFVAGNRKRRPTRRRPERTQKRSSGCDVAGA
jgi:hypothetical protein